MPASAARLAQPSAALCQKYILLVMGSSLNRSQQFRSLGYNRAAG
jgi:hypothetical protein